MFRTKTIEDAAFQAQPLSPDKADALKQAASSKEVKMPSHLNISSWVQAPLQATRASLAYGHSCRRRTFAARFSSSLFP